MSSYRFIAWSRRGLAAAIPAQAPAAARARIDVTLTVAKGAAETEDVTRTLALYGPGDVVALDGRQIIRREPRPGSADFEPNYFPSVEFDTPELPWLVSPDPSATTVKPWLVLVVVRRELARLDVDPRRPLPFLSLAAADAQTELPDLSESWAWAHVQLAGTDAPPVEALDGRDPERTLARLLSPRRLAPQRAYLACLVPAYLAGVQSGRGEPVTAGAEPAWPPPGGWGTVTGRFELPVYDHWEFATAEVGDFELLVRRLRPFRAGPDIGVLPVDISDPDPAFDSLHLPTPTLLDFEGALVSPERPARQWPPGVQTRFQQRLEDLIEVPPGVDATVLRPPVYGTFQAGTGPVVPDAGAARPWLRELNLDPGWRAAAALGTRVVQEHQESLMASAWDQAGELERANSMLRQAELARAATGGVRDKHLDGLPPDGAVRVTEPVHSRIRVAADGTPHGSGVSATLRSSVRQSVFPEAAVSPPFRRALRPAGPLGRRLPAPAPQVTAQLSDGLAVGRLRVPIRPARGGADFDDVGARITPPGGDAPRFQQLRDNLAEAGGWRKVATDAPDDGGFYIGADPFPSGLARSPATAIRLPGDPWDVEEPGRRGDRVRGINNRFKQATDFLLQHLPSTVEAPPPAGAHLGLAPVADTLVGRGGVLEPDRTVTRAVATLVPPAEGARDLAPRKVTPRFPQPMSQPLSTLDGQMLLPGIDRIPEDSLSVLVGNPRFVEAFMAGLNHELSRELLWRGLPAELSATFADRFWDVRGLPGRGDDTATLPAIATWPGALGANAAQAAGADLLVLLIRGRLLLRYPHTAVYAARAVSTVDGGLVPGPDERYPLFRGTVDPDVSYLGFDLDLTEARGDDGGPGWFFVIQEQPTAPRFGLDEPDGPPAPPASWSDLDWADLVPAGTDPSTIRYAGLSGPLSTPPATLPVLAGRPQPTATWAADAAQMAAITFQRPLRVAVHARTALPETNS
ncbi:hypothetical protein [Virgisporangium aurantiacum]|uniref:Uncharacterized protein n=1 Tax=Virgisporangium aurantiacum TaxID=175570 RepID=A0A8J3ZC04_9ACTN|nr:hypothetical protein [Virgisporangium aurantiacum]GIJ58478.1 hypothetical protein Vau01_059940 [Virgisporangium aurantiacum]